MSSAAEGVERFQPSGALHALVSGLLEAAFAAILGALSLLAGGERAAASGALLAGAVLWAVLAGYSLAVAWLRARVWSAELDAEGVVLRRLGGTRRFPYERLAAVEVRRGRTRLVDRDARVHAVRAVRGQRQGTRFREAVLARATAAADRAGEDGT